MGLQLNKFNIGDKLYFINNNKIQHGYVGKISIETREINYYISENPQGYSPFIIIEKEEYFALSKEELIEKMFNVKVCK